MKAHRSRTAEADADERASPDRALHQGFVRRIDAHFARTISPNEEAKLRSHLPECSPCRGYYDRHLLLEELDPEGGDAKSRIAVGLGLRLGRTPIPFGLAAVAAVALAAMVPLLGPALGSRWAGRDTATRHEAAAESEYAARGSAGVTAAPHLLIYRLAPNRPSELVNGVISANDELAFAYTNAGNFERLLVFGVDEHRHVYWYHPAWSSEGQNPVAVPIAPGPQVHELGEAVSQPLDGRHLRITAIFTRDTLAVKEVERMLRDANTGDIDFTRARPVATQVEVTLEVAR
jgi:hypothetical protein